MTDTQQGTRLFVVIRHPDIPPLGWLLDLAEPLPILHCGSSVECDERSFFEGAWAGDFAAADFSEVPFTFGSGAVFSGNTVTLVTPCHTLDGIYMFDCDGEPQAVSNSLAFLFHYCRLTPHPDFREGARFASIVRGVDDYATNVVRTATGQVRRFAAENITVSLRPLSLLESTGKPNIFPFADFAAYHDFLAGQLAILFANATSPQRRTCYQPLATCSSGYDSSAVSALAAEVGCRNAVTLIGTGGSPVDSGAAVGRQIGLHVEEFSFRPETMPIETEAEFLAAGMGGEDCYFSVFAPRLGQAMILTGFHGDKLWDIHIPSNDCLERGDISGSSLGEFRLRANFVHVPVLFLGARNHRSIREISRSPAMKPWRLGNDYDRPIPRRIVEERGVARGDFGQSKRAASRLLFFDESLLQPGTRAAVAAYTAVLERQPEIAQQCERARKSWENARMLGEIPMKILMHLRHHPTGNRLIRGTLGKNAQYDWRIFEHSRPRAVYAFLWALDALSPRYTAAGHRNT